MGRPDAGILRGLERGARLGPLLTLGTQGRRGSRGDPRAGAREGGGGRAEPAARLQPPASPAAAGLEPRPPPPRTRLGRRCG